MANLEVGRLAFSIEEVANALGLSLRHTYEMARTGQLPARRLGHRWIIPRAALERLLEEVQNGEPYKVPIEA